MEYYHSSLDFIRFSVPKQIGFYHSIIFKMKDNPIFVKPSPSLETAASLLQQYQVAFTAAQDGGRTTIDAMLACIELTEQCFRQLAAYVNRIANGNQDIILSSGFNLYKEINPKDIPDISVAKGSQPGSLIVERMLIPDAKTYIWQYAIGALPRGKRGWVEAGYTSLPKLDLIDLIPDQNYFIRVAAITKARITDFCNPVMVKVS